MSFVVSSHVTTFAGKLTRFGRSRFGFRVGYRTASIACAIALAWCLVVVWRRAPEAPLFGEEAAVGATLSVVVLLLAGLALRIARRKESGLVRPATGVVRGALTAVAREAEVATGFVASLIAGAAVASSPSSCEAIAGWLAPALDPSGTSCATATTLIVAAIGTVTTELARRGISRSLERV